MRARDQKEQEKKKSERATAAVNKSKERKKERTRQGKVCATQPETRLGGGVETQISVTL